MPICASCGRESAAGFSFCPYCAAPLAAEQVVREQRKTVTVLFCDVAGSTALGERLDPESLRRVMARYFEAMADVIERHGGTVEKFIGDAVMAVFGVPVVHEDDALRAVRTAAEMRQALATLNLELERDYGTSLELRIGVNTGEVVTGSAERLATGDAVNVAARLEQAAQPGEVLLGEQTLRLVRDALDVEAVEPLSLKGKHEPVTAFRLVSVRPDSPGIARRQDASMVGRARERRLLADAWERTLSEQACCLFTILGTAGVGKSRLVAEFLGSIGDATVLTGRCLSYGEGITYWPVAELVIQLLGEDPELGRFALDDRAEGALRGILGGAEVASTEETAWAVRKLLEAAARERPLVAVLDDLHWAEPTLLDLVEHVADISRDVPIMLLCMARPDLLDRRPGWSGGKLNASTVLLEPLSVEETDLLLGDLLGETSIDTEVRDRVLVTAEGNPLFVEEMVAMLHDSRGDGQTVPPTIQALLAARLDQLEPRERTVLERGAVEGRVFHRGAVQALGPEELQLSAQLTKLVRKELVRPDKPQFAADDAFRFRHLLIRDAAYDGLAKSTRAQLHERFAGWLKERGADLIERDEIIGHHLEQAYRYRAELGPLDDKGSELGRRAARLLSAAGHRALDRGDWPAAVKLLGRAVSVLPTEDPHRLELLPALATALEELGEYGPAQNLLEEAIALAVAAGDKRVGARARLARTFLLRQVDPEHWYSEIERVVAEAGEVFRALGDERGLAQTARLLGLAGWDSLRLELAESSLLQAVDHARRAGDRTEERAALTILMYSYSLGPTPTGDAERRLEEFRESARGDLLVEAAWLEAKGTLAMMRGRFDDGRDLAAHSVALLDELGLKGRSLLVQFRGAHWALWAGEPESAERAARHCCEEYERMNERGWRSTASAVLGMALAALGRYEEALRCSELSRELGTSGDTVNELWWRLNRTAALTGLGEYSEAERVGREAVAITAQTDIIVFHADALTALARVLHLAGRDSEAAKLVDEALAIAERKDGPAIADRARAALA